MDAIVKGMIRGKNEDDDGRKEELHSLLLPTSGRRYSWSGAKDYETGLGAWPAAVSLSFGRAPTSPVDRAGKSAAGHHKKIPNEADVFIPAPESTRTNRQGIEPCRRAPPQYFWYVLLTVLSLNCGTKLIGRLVSSQVIFRPTGSQ